MFEVGFQGFCKLVGARGVHAAPNAFEKGNDLFGRLALDEAADALQIAAASADEFYVANFVFRIQIEDDLFAASAVCRIGNHNISSLICERFINNGIELESLVFPFFIDNVCGFFIGYHEFQL